MNRQEAGFFFRPRIVSCSTVPPNNAMPTDGRFATAADRQGVGLRLRDKRMKSERRPSVGRLDEIVMARSCSHRLAQLNL